MASLHQLLIWSLALIQVNADNDCQLLGGVMYGYPVSQVCAGETKSSRSVLIDMYETNDVTACECTVTTCGCTATVNAPTGPTALTVSNFQNLGPLALCRSSVLLEAASGGSLSGQCEAVFGSIPVENGDVITITLNKQAQSDSRYCLSLTLDDTSSTLTVTCPKAATTTTPTTTTTTTTTPKPTTTTTTTTTPKPTTTTTTTTTPKPITTSTTTTPKPTTTTTTTTPKPTTTTTITTPKPATTTTTTTPKPATTTTTTTQKPTTTTTTTTPKPATTTTTTTTTPKPTTTPKQTLRPLTTKAPPSPVTTTTTTTPITTTFTTTTTTTTPSPTPITPTPTSPTPPPYSSEGTSATTSSSEDNDVFEQSQHNMTIIIPVVTGFFLLIVLLIVLRSCCTRNRKRVEKSPLSPDPRYYAGGYNGAKNPVHSGYDQRYVKHNSGMKENVLYDNSDSFPTDPTPVLVRSDPEIITSFASVERLYSEGTAPPEPEPTLQDTTFVVMNEPEVSDTNESDGDNNVDNNAAVMTEQDPNTGLGNVSVYSDSTVDSFHSSQGEADVDENINIDPETPLYSVVNKRPSGKHVAHLQI
ncbi:Filamentous hemagglutinin [Mizuhopecten yessoensis]|uniref:Filamentous hemagglutinin n=1 Tax=Mizuhopecten yessoensis TaxID=6573 RepID=A0A210R185_MIZYE|nr:Filamentous hemagglutinin [Mizuhopecten yessoensis]